jgi:subtilase family serine protease
MQVKNLAQFALTIGAAALFAGCGGSLSPMAPGAIPQSPSRSVAPQWQAMHLARTFCPQVIGKPTCLALQVTPRGISPLRSPSGSGFTPAELQAAYNITGSLAGGSGTKVAVIEAGDLSAASSDLATYRSQFGLGTASFFKYNESGKQSSYPPSCSSYGWCLETDLDIDMVSASCPNCTIYLMEAKGQISDFEQAEKEAVTLGATILSNSWICYGSWDCKDSNFPHYFDTPGIAYLASSGDAGPDQIGGPSVLSTVVALGGTQLKKSGSKFSEKLWRDGGAGCASASLVGAPGVKKPSWQHDPDCSYRNVADVSAESGCSPGVAVYISMYGGWNGVCGTSVASPFTAGVIALAGNAGKIYGGKTFWSFDAQQHKIYFNHPTGGHGRYEKYYSGPGGWGTPNGIKGY